MIVKNKKIVISVILCVTMLLGLFAGCSVTTDSKTYYAFCGLAGIKENSNGEFYFLKNSVSNDYNKTIVVEECYFDEPTGRLIIGLVYNDSQGLNEEEAEPKVLLDDKEISIYKWRSEIENTAPSYENECRYTIYLKNIENLSEKNIISVCIRNSKVDFSLDKQIGTTNPDELGFLVQDLGDGLKLAICDGSYKNKKGFYLSVITDKTYYDTAVISRGKLSLQNTDTNENLFFDNSVSSFVLGELGAVFCYSTDDIDYKSTDLHNCSFLYDLEIFYGHALKESIDIDLFNSKLPLEVTCDALNNNEVTFIIDKRTEKKNDVLEINALNINEFDNGGIIIKMIDGEKTVNVTETEAGKYQIDIKKGMERAVLKIYLNNFCKYFSGEIKV